MLRDSLHMSRDSLHPGGLEGVCRSSLDARKPHNPTKSSRIPGVSSGCVVHRLNKGDALGPQP
eukprot:428035-Pyramimonas_sp.AAC.1